MDVLPILSQRSPGGRLALWSSNTVPLKPLMGLQPCWGGGRRQGFGNEIPDMEKLKSQAADVNILARQLRNLCSCSPSTRQSFLKPINPLVSGFAYIPWPWVESQGGRRLLCAHFLGLRASVDKVLLSLKLL